MVILSIYAMINIIVPENSSWIVLEKAIFFAYIGRRSYAIIGDYNHQ